MRILTVGYLLAEILVFILMWQAFGFFKAFFITFLTVVIGAVINALVIRRVVRNLGRSAATARSAEGLGEVGAGTALTLFGSMLLLIPGVVSLIIGLLFILPPTQKLLSRVLTRALHGWIVSKSRVFLTTTSTYSGTKLPREWGTVIDHRADEGPSGPSTGRDQGRLDRP